MGQRPRPLTPDASPLALLGSELKARRTAAGLSQAALGRMAHVSGDLIGKIEKAERRPLPDVARRLDLALGAGGALVRKLPAAAVGKRSGPVPVPVAGMVCRETVIGLGDVVRGFRRIDHSLGPAGVLNSLQASIDLALRLRVSTSGALHRDLLTVLAEAHQLAGWMQFDDGALPEAQRLLERARELAVEADDPALVAYVLGPSHGFALTYSGKPKEGLQLTQEALTWATRSGNALLEAFVLAIAARAHARLGDEPSCLRDLESAQVALTRHEPSPTDPIWLSVFDTAALEGHRGSCLLDLGRAGAAIESLAVQDAAAPGHYVRNRVIWMLDRAEALVRVREVEEACDTGELALTAAAGTSSRRIRCRLHTAAAALEGCDLPHAVTLRERIAALPVG